MKEVVSKLSQAKVPLTLHANCGHWQLALETQRSNYAHSTTQVGAWEVSIIRQPFGIIQPQKFSKGDDKVV